MQTKYILCFDNVTKQLSCICFWSTFHSSPKLDFVVYRRQNKLVRYSYLDIGRNINVTVT